MPYCVKVLAHESSLAWLNNPSNHAVTCTEKLPCFFRARLGHAACMHLTGLRKLSINDISILYNLHCCADDGPVSDQPGCAQKAICQFDLRTPLMLCSQMQPESSCRFW